MKLERFFDKFELFADAPNAVAKMQELVFQLAVQGRLVQHDRNEEPATVLLKRIRAARATLPANRRSGDEVDTIELDVESAPFVAPPGWVWTSLGNVQVYTNGFAFKSDDYQPSGVGIIRMGELGANGEIDERNMKYVSEDIAQSLPDSFRVKPGDLLMGMSGSIGKLAINHSSNVYLLNQRVGRLEPILIEKSYLYVFLKTVEQHYLRISYGMAIKNLSTKQINETPFPLPPLAEQKRIVAKVDELMALCDRLEAQQQERDTRHAALARASLARFAEAPNPANLDFLFHKSYAITPADIRKAILTLAVQGKLVPQDPNDGEPENELQKIHKTRLRQAKVGKLRAAKVPANTYLEEPLPFIPDSWRTVSFDHLAVAHNNALKAGPFGSALKKEFYVEKGYKIYGQEQVIAGDPFLGDYYIDEKKYSELESCVVSPGDILISLVGTIGKILVLPEGIEPGIINPRLIKLSLDATLVYPMFIRILIGSPYAVDFFEENAHGGTMNILNLSILRTLPLPLPPLAEQRRIVTKVDQLMALVDQMETQLTASRATAEKLMEAVVAELTASAAPSQTKSPPDRKTKNKGHAHAC